MNLILLIKLASNCIVLTTVNLSTARGASHLHRSRQVPSDHTSSSSPLFPLTRRQEHRHIVEKCPDNSTKETCHAVGLTKQIASATSSTRVGVQGHVRSQSSKYKSADKTAADKDQRSRPL